MVAVLRTVWTAVATLPLWLTPRGGGQYTCDHRQGPRLRRERKRQRCCRTPYWRDGDDLWGKTGLERGIRRVGHLSRMVAVPRTHRMECGSNATALAHTARRRAVYLRSSPETPAPPEVKAAALLPHSILARRSTVWTAVATLPFWLTQRGGMHPKSARRKRCLTADCRFGADPPFSPSPRALHGV